MKAIVAQIGAREHYAVAQALYQRGLLVALVTDWYAFGHGDKYSGRSIRSLASASRILTSVVRHPSALTAHCEVIPDDLVHAFPLRSLLWKWRIRRLSRHERNHERYTQIDAAFTRAVARHKLPAHDVFFGYSYMSLEILEAAQGKAMLTVLGQIDPGPAEFRLVAEAMTANPELAGIPQPFPAKYYDRLRHEWELADVIVVNSEWSRDALISEGVNSAKLEVLPLAYEGKLESQKSKSESPKVRESQTPLRVLWLGQVNVRKGIHHLIEAARLLERENIQFDIVGPLGILPGAVEAAPKNMTFHGSVSRDRATEWYQYSDLFVLPTLSDGFALTQLEALAHGLPVIATPNCGRVVEDGMTGFIVPARDAQALADAILRFVKTSGLAAEMAGHCREAVKAYSIDAYGQRLVGIIEKHKALLAQVGER